MTYDRVKPPNWSSHSRLGAGRWNPWKTLVEDYPDWKVVTRHELPPDIIGLTSFSKKRIWLCSAASPIQQECTLAHELVHVERGKPADDREAANAEERIVEEVTARRLIPLRDFAHELTKTPDAMLSYLAANLRVDQATLEVRILTLTPNERQVLAAVRGGPLHWPPHRALWDDPDFFDCRPGNGKAARCCATLAAPQLGPVH